VTTTESSKVFVKEETEEGEEETFPNFYPTISIDEDPLKRYRYLTCKCFLLYFYWKARSYRHFVAYTAHLMLMLLFIDLLIMINQNQGKRYLPVSPHYG
jgi:hypothetical protein